MGGTISQLELLEKKLSSVASSPDDQIIKTASRKPTKAAPQNAQKKILHAQPIQYKNEAMVNAFDGREQILTTAKWPSSVHGVVAIKFLESTGWGTGTLIGPNVVLTAGHNLYNHKQKVYADLSSMQFLPGMNGQMLPFGVVKVEKYFVSPNYIKNEEEDYGILILKEPVGEMTGYFGFTCLEPEEIKKKSINVTGYPGDKVASKPNIYEMWGMSGVASSVDQKKGHINYLIDTASGQSGSGVWYKEGEDYYVCGVHVGGNQFANTATLLTKSIYQQIYAWLKQEGSCKELFPMLGKKLELRNQEIDEYSVSLLEKYTFAKLAFLDLSSNKIGSEGAKKLAGNTSWINLSQLDLSRNNLGAEGAKALAQNKSWSNLSELDLSCNNIGAEGARALAKNTSWVNLSSLRLFENKLGPEGAKALAQNNSWISLSSLDLRGNNIDFSGDQALEHNKTWQKGKKITTWYLLYSGPNINQKPPPSLFSNYR